MTPSLLTFVENRMRAVADPLQVGDYSVARAVLHHLGAGGSRVRANLCLNASLKLGLETEDAITLATICELLHNASLIQDDLIDRAPSRRSLPSVWAAFDDSTAVCAGDLLLVSSFALVGELRCVESLAPVLSLVHRRTRDVIFGQGAEQSSATETLEGYESLAIGKSASLLSLPLELPLLLSGNQRFFETAQRAAERFAVAYQMLDDLADYDEDLRNGALNAVSVALTMGDAKFHSASALVCDRAEELIQSSIEQAFDLPMDCGALMVEYAAKMRVAVLAYRQSVVDSKEWSHRAG